MDATLVHARAPRGPSRVFASARAWLDEPVDIASLAAFRVILGGLLFSAVVRFWNKGGIFDAFVAPKFFFGYPGLEWVKPLPGNGMYFVYAVMGVLALAFSLGFFFRFAAWALCALFTYAHLADAANYLNHYYLVSLLTGLLACSPAGSFWSLDARRNPELRRDHVARWVLLLVRFQVGAVYLFGGIAKLKSDWLVAAQPLSIWLAASGDFPVLGPLLVLPQTAFFMSWAGALYDLSIPWLLSVRKTRPFAYVAVVVFHLVTARLFQIGMFPWIMMGASLVFCAPDWPRTAWSAWARLFRVAPRALGSSRPPRSVSIVSPWGVLAMSYVFVQVAMPLRHWAHGGCLLWHEQGYRFSWNVMLMEKTGSAEFRLRDPERGAEREVRARDWLTPFQVKMMSTQPDMIASFARFLADRTEALEGRRPTVHADVFVALNGRPSARYVDPEVDLAGALSHDPLRWILPPPWLEHPASARSAPMAGAR